MLKAGTDAREREERCECGDNHNKVVKSTEIEREREHKKEGVVNERNRARSKEKEKRCRPEPDCDKDGIHSSLLITRRQEAMPPYDKR